MERICNDCQARYDDADCSTICPHQLIMPREDLERKKLAFTLLEKPLRFHHLTARVPGNELKAPDVFAPPLFVSSISWDGMVTLRGLDAYGEFAPSLFAVYAPQEVEQLP